MAVSWDAALSIVASILQILGVDVAMALLVVVGALCLRSCKLERGQLKRRVAELEALHLLPTGERAEQVLRAAGLWEESALAIQDAKDLVQAYDRSSVFHVVCHSRSMQMDMVVARSRVSSSYDRAVGVHAGVAVGFGCV